jgi:hypothetical protein
MSVGRCGWHLKAGGSYFEKRQVNNFASPSSGRLAAIAKGIGEMAVRPVWKQFKA